MSAAVDGAAAARGHRGTICVEDAALLSVTTHPGEQYVQRIAAPGCAARATPGSFVHIRCDDAIPMRRPLSIMRANSDEGWIEVLFKIVGDGMRALAARRPGDLLSVMGPIGCGFVPHPERPRTLLVGGGVGIPPMIFLAETLDDDSRDWQPLVLMGSELPFPFELLPSTDRLPGLPAAADAAMADLDARGIPSRLASLAGFDGCFEGYVTELADQWLENLDPAALAETGMFACGPTPMLEAAAAVARRHGVPCQVSLEEYMACAVGGCAGCTVLVQLEDGPAMKRVCVDGPVFDAASVFPPGAG